MLVESCCIFYPEDFQDTYECNPCLFQELVRPKGQLQTLHFIPCYCVMPDVVESHSELTFLKLFEQIGEAMPQFLIAFKFYVHHTYYLDIYDAIVP